MGYRNSLVQRQPKMRSTMRESNSMPSEFSTYYIDIPSIFTEKFDIYICSQVVL